MNSSPRDEEGSPDNISPGSSPGEPAGDTRFLDVCVDGDVEDLVQLLEEMARAGETLSPDILNCVDPSGRVRN